MSWELFDDDPLTLTKQYFHDNGDGTYTVATVEDYGPLLEDNYHQRVHNDERAKWGDGKIHTRLPNTVLFDLMRRGIIGDDFDLNTPKMRRWINSSENIWRVRGGRA